MATLIIRETKEPFINENIPQILKEIEKALGEGEHRMTPKTIEYVMDEYYFVSSKQEWELLEHQITRYGRIRTKTNVDLMSKPSFENWKENSTPLWSVGLDEPITPTNTETNGSTNG